MFYLAALLGVHEMGLDYNLHVVLESFGRAMTAYASQNDLSVCLGDTGRESGSEKLQQKVFSCRSSNLLWERKRQV